jgi:hypothetical protein
MRAKRTEDPRLKENVVSQAGLVAHAAMPAPIADSAPTWQLSAVLSADE